MSLLQNKCSHCQLKHCLIRASAFNCSFFSFVNLLFSDPLEVTFHVEIMFDSGKCELLLFQSAINLILYFTEPLYIITLHFYTYLYPFKKSSRQRAPYDSRAIGTCPHYPCCNPSVTKLNYSYLHFVISLNPQTKNLGKRCHHFRFIRVIFASKLLFKLFDLTHLPLTLHFETVLGNCCCFSSSQMVLRVDSFPL